MDANEIAVRPGTTCSQRRDELNNARFVAIRNLVNMKYTKANGEPLMSYADTLGDREVIKQAVLEYELARGMLINDGTATVTISPESVFGPPTNGPMMTAQTAVPFTPPNGAPAPAAAAANLPAMAQPPMAAGVVVGQMTGQDPNAQQLPRQSRRKATQAGAGVAAPPAAPPPTSISSEPVGFNPTLVATPVGAAAFAPPVNTGPVAAFTPGNSSPAPVAVSPATVDLSPVLATLDQLGKGVEVAANNADHALKAIAELRQNQQLMMVMLHHMYLTSVNKGAPATLPEFIASLKQFLPQ